MQIGLFLHSEPGQLYLPYLQVKREEITIVVNEEEPPIEDLPHTAILTTN